jgi:anti-sigma regulatory factor (Ser/Thr protein kinase)
MEFKISNTFDTKERIKELVRNLIYLNEKNTSDLSNINWVTPLSILPIAYYINKNSKIIEKLPNNNVASYLKTIGFPEGRDEIIENFNEYDFKNYLPILKIKFNQNDNFETLEQIIEKYINILKRTILKDSKQYEINSVKYMLGEIITNINEHSSADEVYILAQSWSKDMEITIIDNGKGALGSYQSCFDIKTHLEALDLIQQSLSSKDPTGNERGYGIFSTKKLSIQPFNGEVVIFSGDAMLYNDLIFNVPFDFNGFMFSMKLKKEVEPFDMYKYL